MAYSKENVELLMTATEQFQKAAKEYVDALNGKIEELSEALRAAEAECAAWRGQFRRTGWGDEDPTVWHWDGPSQGTLINEPADANDATRARLGLGKIGEAR